MSQRLAYYRISTVDQSIEAQRKALGGSFDQEYVDEGMSGSTRAAERPGFSELLKFACKGDSVHVYAIDRLGRDAIDVQTTVKALLDKGVVVDVQGLGPIAGDAGRIIVAVLAQMAEIERNRITERCQSGRATARASLAATGKTHRGKLSLGRPTAQKPREVAQWRKDNNASIKQTADKFNINPSTVKRYCAADPAISPPPSCVPKFRSAFSSKERMRPAKSACGPSGPENHASS